METYSIEVAQGCLSQLAAEAQTGKTVVIKTECGRAVKLVPIPLKLAKARKPGSAQGKVWMADDFDEPLDDFQECSERGSCLTLMPSSGLSAGICRSVKHQKT